MRSLNGGARITRDLLRRCLPVEKLKLNLPRTVSCHLNKKHYERKPKLGPKVSYMNEKNKIENSIKL